MAPFSTDYHSQSIPALQDPPVVHVTVKQGHGVVVPSPAAEIVATPTTAATARSPLTPIAEKQVSFCPSARLYPVESRTSFTEQEHTQTWYSSEDLQSMARDAMEEAKLHQRQYQYRRQRSHRSSSSSSCDGSTSTGVSASSLEHRGLEFHTFFHRIRNNRLMALHAVLKEQYDQRLMMMSMIKHHQHQHRMYNNTTPIYNLHHHMVDYPERIRMAYRMIAEPCQQEAYQVAVCDHQQVQDLLLQARQPTTTAQRPSFSLFESLLSFSSSSIRSHGSTSRRSTSTSSSFSSCNGRNDDSDTCTFKTTQKKNNSNETCWGFPILKIGNMWGAKNTSNNHNSAVLWFNEDDQDEHED